MLSFQLWSNELVLDRMLQQIPQGRYVGIAVNVRTCGTPFAPILNPDLVRLMTAQEQCPSFVLMMLLTLLERLLLCQVVCRVDCDSL